MLNQIANRISQLLCRCRGHDWTLRLEEDRMFLACDNCPDRTVGWPVPFRPRSQHPLEKVSGGSSVEFIVSVDERTETTDGVRITLRHVEALKRYDLVINLGSDVHGGVRDLRVGDRFRATFTPETNVEHTIEETQRDRLALAQE